MYFSQTESSKCSLESMFSGLGMPFTAETYAKVMGSSSPSQLVSEMCNVRYATEVSANRTGDHMNGAQHDAQVLRATTPMAKMAGG